MSLGTVDELVGDAKFARNFHVLLEHPDRFVYDWTKLSFELGKKDTPLATIEKQRADG